LKIHSHKKKENEDKATSFLVPLQFVLWIVVLVGAEPESASGPILTPRA